MARNEHDGRSLEERLASLDAMNDDATGRPSGSAGEPPAQPSDPSGQQPDGAGEQAPGQVPQGGAPPPEPVGNPWLAAPPALQDPPASGAPPQETQADGPVPPPPGFPGFGDQQQPQQPQQQPAPYDGGPMPQPFDGGMLPPPYPGAGYQGYDPSQLPPLDPAGQQPQQPQQPQQQAYQPQQPWEIGQYPAQDPNVAASQPYQPVDPATGQPYPVGPATPPPYPQVDPATGQPYQVGPATPPPYPQVDPNTGRPYDPNAAAAQPYQPVDPNTGQPYPQVDPNAGQAYPQVDPNTGQPYPQVDPNTGQPYPQVDPSTGQPYAPIDPNTGQPMQGYAYPPGYPQPQPQPQDGEGADSLSSENLLGERRIAPSSGWRRAVYKASGGNIHMGESQGDLRRKDLVARARTQVAGGHHRVAVMSLKGGVGKTTTTTGLGSMLGSLRGDTVIAVDANPDRGTLSDKVRLETAATVRDLLNSRDKIHRYADVRAFTSQNQARLEVLASDRDPAVSEAFSADDYAAAAAILEQFYSICITDCGTGLLHSAMAGVLSLADQLVLVSSPSVDGARSASATLDWLEAHDHGHLVRNGVVVLSMVRNRTRSQVDLDKLQAHFESRCRAVVRIPYDDHLEEGAEVELEQLAPPTREAYLNLAAVVGDGFAFRRPDNEPQA
ncbi:MinD/ParA family protein [Actinomadura sp. WMMB 499]|uniref:MinD/ParA family ATP-binding protein n=1 Tax=Actinomadura sp. WMMB 499 TaxID=1219491 RepID=UPI0020C824AC|nr:AAA family ATPase [Actinomadura sp. WMMB 499]